MKFKKSTISAIIILVSLATVFGLSGLNFIMPQNTQYADKVDAVKSKTVNKIFLKTRDNVKISADLYETENPIGWLVLIHMMPATKESWKDLAEFFQKAGYGSLAVDLRGHGESDEGPDGYKNFSDVDHQKSIFDAEAAVNYLIREREATPDKISFIGASIGANLSLQYISENSEFKTAILLSAGLDYDGIKTEPLVRNLKAGQKIFLVSSKDDGGNTVENQKLFSSLSDEVKKESEIKIYETAGHGTNMPEEEPGLKNLILDFLNK